MSESSGSLSWRRTFRTYKKTATAASSTANTTTRAMTHETPRDVLLPPASVSFFLDARSFGSSSEPREVSCRVGEVRFVVIWRVVFLYVSVHDSIGSKVVKTSVVVALWSSVVPLTGFSSSVTVSSKAFVVGVSPIAVVVTSPAVVVINSLVSIVMVLLIVVVVTSLDVASDSLAPIGVACVAFVVVNSPALVVKSLPLVLLGSLAFVDVSKLVSVVSIVTSTVVEVLASPSVSVVHILVLVVGLGVRCCSVVSGASVRITIVMGDLGGGVVSMGYVTGRDGVDVDVSREAPDVAVGIPPASVAREEVFTSSVALDGPGVVCISAVGVTVPSPMDSDETEGDGEEDPPVVTSGWTVDREVLTGGGVDRSGTDSVEC